MAGHTKESSLRTSRQCESALEKQDQKHVYSINPTLDFGECKDDLSSAFTLVELEVPN